MERPTTVRQALFYLGRLLGIREVLYQQGAIKFGLPADPATIAELMGIDDLDEMKALAERLMVVSSWTDLLTELRASRSRWARAIVGRVACQSKQRNEQDGDA